MAAAPAADGVALHRGCGHGVGDAFRDVFGYWLLDWFGDRLLDWLVDWVGDGR